MILKENILFANRYQLERLLGRGGFSEVWLAKDSYTNLEIAVKVYAPGQGMDSDGLKEFSAELAGVFNLNHSSLLKPTHVDVWEGMPYLIMPYCAQGAISNRIGKMTENEIWKLIHDVASGLAYLHKNDIVHQDIKPDNILLDDNGNYVITDFGISAKARSTLRKSVIGGATSGGTMAYMGPERFSKQPAPTKASDIWSFGAMVYEMITGNVPFGELGGSMQKAGAEIPEITEPVSDELRSLVEQMLAPEPWNRPTAEQLISLKSTAPEYKSGYTTAEKQKTNIEKVEESANTCKSVQTSTLEKIILIGSLIFIVAGCVIDAFIAIIFSIEGDENGEWMYLAAICMNILCICSIKAFIISIKNWNKNYNEHLKSTKKIFYLSIVLSFAIFLVEFLMDNYYNAWIICPTATLPILLGVFGLIWHDKYALRKSDIESPLQLKDRIAIALFVLIACAFPIVGYGRTDLYCVNFGGISLFLVCCTLLLVVFVSAYILFAIPYCQQKNRRVILSLLLISNVILDIILYFSMVSIVYRGGTLQGSWYKNYIVRVKISDEVQQIDSDAFSNCNYIEEINLQNNDIVKIQNVKLGSCDNLKAFVVSKNNGAYTTEDGVLFNKTKSILIRCPLKRNTYVIPSSVTHIEENAFGSCQIKSVSLPDGLIVIGAHAFSSCSKLTDISIPSNVQYIGDYAFSYCYNITTMKFYSQFDHSFIIKEEAFIGCDNVEKIYVPAGYKGYYSLIYALRNHMNKVEEFITLSSEL